MRSSVLTGERSSKQSIMLSRGGVLGSGRVKSPLSLQRNVHVYNFHQGPTLYYYQMLCCDDTCITIFKTHRFPTQTTNSGSKLLLLTVQRRYSYLNLCFVFVFRVFLTSRCMGDAVCAVVCVCVFCMRSGCMLCAALPARAFSSLFV